MKNIRLQSSGEKAAAGSLYIPGVKRSKIPPEETIRKKIVGSNYTKFKLPQLKTIMS